MVTRNGIWVSRMRKMNAGSNRPRAVQACFFWIFFFAGSTGGAGALVAVVVMSADPDSVRGNVGRLRALAGGSRHRRTEGVGVGTGRSGRPPHRGSCAQLLCASPPFWAIVWHLAS